MKNFIIRTITGAIFVSLVIGSILCERLAFNSLLLVFSLLAMKEYCSIANNLPNVRLNWIFACVGVLLILAPTMFLPYLSHSFEEFKFLSVSSTIIGSIICIVGIAVSELFTFKENNSLHNMSYYVLGLIFISISFLSLLLVNNNSSSFSTYSVPSSILLFACIWINDTGAYLFGTAFGKHKMAPNISPKKSWEGFVGGVFLVTFITTLLWKFNFLEVQYIFYAVITSLVATLGDLLESVFKRRAGVKDSGKLLPGHGGILDRLDSVLLAAPIILLLGTIIETII